MDDWIESDGFSDECESVESLHDDAVVSEAVTVMIKGEGGAWVAVGVVQDPSRSLALCKRKKKSTTTFRVMEPHSFAATKAAIDFMNGDRDLPEWQSTEQLLLLFGVARHLQIAELERWCVSRVADALDLDQGPHEEWERECVWVYEMVGRAMSPTLRER